MSYMVWSTEGCRRLHKGVHTQVNLTNQCLCSYPSSGQHSRQAAVLVARAADLAADPQPPLPLPHLLDLLAGALSGMTAGLADAGVEGGHTAAGHAADKQRLAADTFAACASAVAQLAPAVAAAAGVPANRLAAMQQLGPLLCASLFTLATKAPQRVAVGRQLCTGWRHSRACPSSGASCWRASGRAAAQREQLRRRRMMTQWACCKCGGVMALRSRTAACPGRRRRTSTGHWTT